jgi:hypothetical protein
MIAQQVGADGEHGAQEDAQHVAPQKSVTEQQAAEASGAQLERPWCLVELTQLDQLGRDDGAQTELERGALRLEPGEQQEEQHAPQHVSAVELHERRGGRVSTSETKRDHERRDRAEAGAISRHPAV